jgi:hypothetical protein
LFENAAESAHGQFFRVHGHDYLPAIWMPEDSVAPCLPFLFEADAL